MSGFGEQTSAEVAEEAEHERADLAHTLDQLRDNLQPHNVVDEVMTHARLTPADLSERLFGIARANPVAAAIIGIGAAMLLGSARRKQPAAAPGDRRWADTDRFPSAASPNPQFTAAVPREDRGSRTPFQGDALGIARDARASDRRYDPLKGPSQTVRSVVNSLDSALPRRTGLARLIDEQPLVLAALGVAVGAAVGAAIPGTDVEAQYLGDVSRSVRENASAAARQQLAQFRATTDQTIEQMKATAAQHGATAENLSGLVRDLGDTVRAGSHEVGSQFADLGRRG